MVIVTCIPKKKKKPDRGITVEQFVSELHNLMQQNKKPLAEKAISDLKLGHISIQIEDKMYCFSRKFEITQVIETWSREVLDVRK